MYRDELQGLVRDLERAQLMAREEKTLSSTADQVSRKCEFVRLVAFV